LKENEITKLNLQVSKVWYPAEIRNWSCQVAVPKASDKAKKKTVRTYGPSTLHSGHFSS